MFKMNKLYLRALTQIFRNKIKNKYRISHICCQERKSLLEPNSFLIKKFNELKVLAAFKLSALLQERNTSTSSNEGDDKDRKPNALMNFSPVVGPEIWLTIKNWIMANFIIKPYLDNDFTLREFSNGSKQALAVVSSYLSQGDFKSLKGLLTDEAIREIQGNFSSLTVKERQDLLIKFTDIVFVFPYQIGIMFEDESDKRFAEITVIYHCLNDFQELKEQGKLNLSTEAARDDLKICNYRFIREYTKGVKSDWIINRLGHFKLRHFEK